jgi:hypothetical protein
LRQLQNGESGGKTKLNSPGCEKEDGMSKKKLAGIIAGSIAGIIIIIITIAALAARPPEGWEIYRHEDYRFQFYYPEGWEETFLPPAVVVLAEPLPGAFQHNINVIVEPTTLTLELYAFASRQLMENMGFVILTESYLTVNNRRGHEWLFTKEWPWGTTKARQVVFVADGKAYILTLTALVQTYDDYAAIFDTIVESFVIQD